MVIAALQHGLGNQLFQYAAARAVAARAGAPLWFDTTHYRYVHTRGLDLQRLRVRGRFLPVGLAKLLARTEAGHPVRRLAGALAGLGLRSLTDAEQGYDPRLEQAGWFSRLDGLWQSERYFAGLRPPLLAELEPRAPLPDALAEFVRRAAGEPSVALHVRRGDLVADPSYAETVGALGAAYYEEALTRVKEREPDARVYVFSDDPAWCEEHLPAVLPLEIVSGRRTGSTVEDFAAMKACRHFVIANSTFSWWTAWLGRHPEKRVIAPARFFRVPRPWEMDLLPPEWERIEAAFLPPS